MAVDARQADLGDVGRMGKAMGWTGASCLRQFQANAPTAARAARKYPVSRRGIRPFSSLGLLVLREELRHRFDLPNERPRAGICG